MADGNVAGSLDVGAQPSAERVRFTGTIRDNTKRRPTRYLDDIAVMDGDHHKLKEILQLQMAHVNDSRDLKVKMLEPLAQLTSHTETNDRQTAELLEWSVQQRGGERELLHTDVWRAISHYTYLIGLNQNEATTRQQMYWEVTPRQYQLLWKMQCGIEPLPDISREEEDAEDSDEDFDDFTARRINNFLNEQLAVVRAARAANAQLPSDPPVTPTATPSTTSSAPSATSSATSASPSSESIASTKKRRRNSDSDDDENDGNKTDNSREEGGERPKKKTRTA